MPVISSVGGVGTGANFDPELWLPIVQKARENNLVAAKRLWDVTGFGEIKSKGDVIHVPKLSNYAAVTKTTDTELPQQATTEGIFDLSIATHKGIRISIEDIIQVQASYDLTQMYGEKIGYGLAKSLDTDILSLYTGFTQTVGATTSTDANLSETNIVRALRFLDRADAPMEDRSIITDPFGIEQFRLIDKFTRYDAVGTGKAITEGAFGSIYGVPVYVSNNVQTTSVVGGTLSRALVVHKEAIAYAKQSQPGLEVWRNGPRLQDELIGQILYGTGVYRADHGVVLSIRQ